MKYHLFYVFVLIFVLVGLTKKHRDKKQYKHAETTNQHTEVTNNIGNFLV